MMRAALRLIDDHHESASGTVAERGIHQRARGAFAPKDFEACGRRLECDYFSGRSNLVEKLARVESDVGPHVPNDIPRPDFPQHRIAELRFVSAAAEQRLNKPQQPEVARSSAV